MSAASRPRRARQAAAQISYAETAAASDSDEEEEPKPPPKKRARAPKATKKGKKRGPEESEREEEPAEVVPPDAYLWADIPRGVLYTEQQLNTRGGLANNVKRVDWTTLLPVEVLLEICSHLLPISLWHLAFVNKRMHAALTSDSGAAMWRRQLETPKDNPHFSRLGRAYIPLASRRPKLKGSGDVNIDDDEKFRAAWKKAREERKLPFEAGGPISPLKLSAFYFAKTCQLCGKPTDITDRELLAAVCAVCVDRHATSVDGLARDEDFDDLHPATLELVRTTTRVPSDFNPRQRQPPYALMSDLQVVSERLEELQMEDTASGARPGQRRTRRGRKSASTAEGAEEEAAGSEDAYSHLTPRVRQFVRERVARKAERENITAWLQRYGPSIQYEEEELDAGRDFASQLRKDRGDRIDELIAKEGLFSRFFEPSGSRIEGFKYHPLVSVAEPLTDEVWSDIRPRLYEELGRCVAHNILKHHGARNVTSTTFDWKGVTPTLLTQPSELSDAVWEYVRPQISHLIEEEKKSAHECSTAQAQSYADQKRMAKINAKNKFFRDKLAEIRDIHTDASVQDYLPRLADFCRLPIVRELWDDPNFATSATSKKEDLDKWRDRFEEILEVVGEYKIDVRFAALKTILAATTDRSEAELDALDVEVLADPTYNDSFFFRPSSWVHCSFCSHFGPLAEVLRTRQVRHAEDGLSTPAGLPREKIKDVEKHAVVQKVGKGAQLVGRRAEAIIERSSGDKDDYKKELGKQEDRGTKAASRPQKVPVDDSTKAKKSPTAAVKEPKPVVELSLEVACAMISICEIGGIDANDPTLTAKDFDERFEETRFVWKNGENGRTARRTWEELIRDVYWSARRAHARGTVLPVPEIGRTSLTSRERWRLKESKRQ